jgi:hypothetical protein
VPAGASWLLAIAVGCASGCLDGALRALGLPRGVAVAWALAAAAASAINLPLPPRDPAVLWNPGGTLVPGAFAAFLATRGLRPAAALRAALLAAAMLCAALGWAEAAGVGWPAALSAAAAVSAACGAAGGGPRGALAAACAALLLAAAARGVLGWAGLVPWPATLGGGAAFAAGVLGAAGSQLPGRLGAFFGARPRPVAAAVRQSAR